ncbi:MAG: folate-binding protein YgfZ [Alphaproteobacteria bacterium]
MPHIIELEDRGLLRVSGADRVAFLQGLISNDVEKVTENHAVYACFLTPQGKFLHDMIIYDGPDRESLWLDVDRERLPDLMRRLRMFKLRSDVDLTDLSEDYDSYAVIGQGASDLFELGDQPGDGRTWDGGMVAIDPRLPAMGVRLILPAGTGFASLARIDADDADMDAYELHRIRHCIPKAGPDLQVERTILLEANIDRLNGIDWRKGCYMGQELTARTHYRGLIKRRFYPVSTDEPIATEVIDIVNEKGRTIGELLSFSGNDAIARLKIDAAESGETLTVDGTPLHIGKPPLTPEKAGAAEDTAVQE